MTDHYLCSSPEVSRYYMADVDQYKDMNDTALEVCQKGVGPEPLGWAAEAEQPITLMHPKMREIPFCRSIAFFKP
jgi:hypothetical protein